MRWWIIANIHLKPVDQVPRRLSPPDYRVAEINVVIETNNTSHLPVLRRSATRKTAEGLERDAIWSRLEATVTATS